MSQAPVTPAGVQIPADPKAPLVLDFVSHALRVALVTKPNVGSLPVKDWDCPGVYVLIGQLSTDDAADVYVGKAKSLRRRLGQHRVKPKMDWWRAVAVARDTTDGFNSAQIGYLEGRLSRQLSALPRIELVASQEDIDETLPDHLLIPLDAFVPTILAALRLAGLDTTPQEEPEAEPATRKGRLKTPGTVADLVAAGLVRPGEKLVFDSRGHRAEAQINPAGEIVLDGVTYWSPSGAGKAVLNGKAVNGWTAWTVGEVGPTLAVLRDRFNSEGDDGS